MESVQGILDFINAEVIPHWPALMFIIVIAVIAQTLKTRVLTSELAKTNRAIFWLRRTFPLGLLLLGLIAGLTWPGEASPGVSRTIHKVWYFMGCSGISILGFNVFKQWVKKKYDVDIDIAGGTSEIPVMKGKK